MPIRFICGQFRPTTFLYLLLLVCGTSCVKEYSDEGGGLIPNSGTAIFAFNQVNGGCANVLVSGQYTVGVPLNQTNTVRLFVTVTQPGTYTVSTTLLNGMQFTSAGMFDTAGVQTILLVAQGTPITASTTSFTTPVAGFCSFSITADSPTVVAAGYTLAGSPNSCTSAFPEGNYVVGTSMSLSNFIQLSVNVVTTGPYSISTDTVNGFYFAAAGNFAATGLQVVTLQAFGTPIDPMNVYFTPRTASSSCGFVIPVTNPQPLATYVLESGVIPGGTTRCVATIAGVFTSGIALNNSNTIRVRVYVTDPGNFTIATPVSNGIYFSYTGSFSTSGTQYVTLVGHGTPVISGVTLVKAEIVGPAPLGGASCNCDVPIQ